MTLEACLAVYEESAPAPSSPPPSPATPRFAATAAIRQMWEDDLQQQEAERVHRTLASVAYFLAAESGCEDAALQEFLQQASAPPPRAAAKIDPAKEEQGIPKAELESSCVRDDLEELQEQNGQSRRADGGVHDALLERVVAQASVADQDVIQELGSETATDARANSEGGVVLHERGVRSPSPPGACSSFLSSPPPCARSQVAVPPALQSPGFPRVATSPRKSLGSTPGSALSPLSLSTPPDER